MKILKYIFHTTLKMIIVEMLQQLTPKMQAIMQF